MPGREMKMGVVSSVMPNSSDQEESDDGNGEEEPVSWPLVTGRGVSGSTGQDGKEQKGKGGYCCSPSDVVSKGFPFPERGFLF